jgi:hypothetical protein
MTAIEPELAAGIPAAIRPSFGETTACDTSVERFPAPALPDLSPPDIVGDSLSADNLAVRAVSFLGTAHATFKKPRQDSFAIASNDHWVVAVVSDGIGSCENSHHGSAAAASSVADGILSGEVDPHNTFDVLSTASAACVQVAQRLRISQTSVSATLTVLAIERAQQPDGGHRALIHAAGDSPALVLDPAEARWTYLTPSEDGPSNVVRSWVPDRHDEVFSAGYTLPSSAILVIASDGFTTPLGDGYGLLGKDLAARWSRASSFPS